MYGTIDPHGMMHACFYILIDPVRSHSGKSRRLTLAPLPKKLHIFSYIFLSIVLYASL